MPFRHDSRHETAGASRHRDVVFQQLSAEILREVHDQRSLDIVSNRVLSHPEVRRDSQLDSMLRSCIGQAAGELNARLLRQRSEQSEPVMRPIAAASTAASVAPSEASQRDHAIVSFERLRRLYDEKLLNFELDAAGRLLAQIEEFQQLHAGTITRPMIERCRMDMTRVEQRRAEFAVEVEALARSAISSARGGRLDEASRALKRLSSIRAARPRLLSEERLESIRTAIESGGDHFEHREASRELVARERSVAEEIRKLGEIVHEFHRVSHEIPHGDPTYLEAEKRYLDAVREVRHHDQEWLADLMVELDELQAELHDTSGRTEAQVTRFLHSVKVSIAQIVKEIREIRDEQSAERSRASGSSTR
jgi:hypothetical protein